MKDDEKFLKMCDYFELLLKICSLGKNEEYQLNEYEKDLLNDKNLYNNFMLSVLTRASMNGVEEENIIYADKDFKKNVLNLISSDMDYGDLDDFNKLIQIRNCFCHSNAWCNGDSLYLFNHKIKGFINSEVAFFNILVLFSSFEYNGKFKKRYTHYLPYLPKNITDSKDLNNLINNSKKVETKFNNSSMNDKFNDIIFNFTSFSTLLNCSCNEITKRLCSFLNLNYSDIKIRPLDDLERSLLKEYIDLIGIEEFYNQDYDLQKNIILDVLNLFEKENVYAYIGLSAIMTGLLEKKYHTGDSISFKNLFSDDCEDKSNNIINRLCSYLFRPILYERLLMVYHTYIFNVLKENKMNDNYLDDFIDYDELNLDRFDFNYNFKNDDIKVEKNKLIDYYNECLRLVKKYDDDLVKLKESRMIIDNPKNKKRDELLKKNNDEINKVLSLIEKNKIELNTTLFKLDYLNNFNRIYKDNNQFFRGMRNSNTHYGFNIYRSRAYKNKDFNDLCFNYYDVDNGKKVFECNFTNSDFFDLVDQMKKQILEKNKKLIK